MKHSVGGRAAAGCGRVILSRQDIVPLREMNYGGDAQSDQRGKGDGKEPCHDPQPLSQNADLLFLGNLLAADSAPQLRIGTVGDPDGGAGVYRGFFHNLKTLGTENLSVFNVPAAPHAVHVAHPQFNVYHIVQQFASFVKAFFRSSLTKIEENCLALCES